MSDPFDRYQTCQGYKQWIQSMVEKNWSAEQGTDENFNSFHRYSVCFFHGITKTVPSLFHGIFSERNFDGNPNPNWTCVKNHRRGIWYGWSMGRPLNLIYKSIFLRGSHCTYKRLQKTVSTCTVHNVSIVKILFLKNQRFIMIWKVHIYVQCTMHNKYIQSNIVKMRRLRGWCRHWWSSTGPKGRACTQGHIPPFFSLSNKLLWGERGGTVCREPQPTYYSE